MMYEKDKQAEADVVPSSSLVEIEVEVEVEAGVDVEVGIEVEATFTTFTGGWVVRWVGGVEKLRLELTSSKFS